MDLSKYTFEVQKPPPDGITKRWYIDRLGYCPRNWEDGPEVKVLVKSANTGGN